MYTKSGHMTKLDLVLSQQYLTLGDTQPGHMIVVKTTLVTLSLDIGPSLAIMYNNMSINQILSWTGCPINQLTQTSVCTQCLQM